MYDRGLSEPIHQEVRRMSKSKWTLLIYMAGDNSLDQAGVDDLNEMLQVGTSTDVASE